MTNVFDYLNWRGDLLFSKVPVGEIDALVFARLSYMHLEDKVSQDLDKPITINKLAESFPIPMDFKPDVIQDFDIQLLNAIKDLPRYKDVLVTGFVRETDKNREEQFAAVVFKLKDNLIFIAYRGTDHSLVGWKENFNMSYMAPVPAQKSGSEYLQFVAENTHEDIILGGHSKGGNLAVYSAAVAPKPVQKRIKAVYNLDGPGFNEEVIKEKDFAHIVDKVHTFIPQSSVVGLLLEHQGNFTVVHADVNSFRQHNMYFWEVMGGKFVYLQEVTDGSVFIDKTLKDWLNNMSAQELEEFVQGLFSVFEETQVDDLSDIADNWYQNAPAIFKSISNMEPSTREVLSTAFRSLIKSAQGNFSLFAGNPTKNK